MNERSIVRERLAWTAVVTVLATSLAWLAVIGVWLLLAAGHDPRIVAIGVVLRAMVRVILALLASAGPMLIASLLVAGGLVWLAGGSGSDRDVNGSVRHA